MVNQLPKASNAKQSTKTSKSVAVTQKPCTFIIHPLELKGRPDIVYQNYVQCLQVLSFTVLQRDFTGSALDISDLESGIPIYDFVLACQLVSKPDFDMKRCVVRKLQLPASVEDWFASLRKDSLAKAKAMFDIHMFESDEAVKAGNVPAAALEGYEGFRPTSPVDPPRSWADAPMDEQSE